MKDIDELIEEVDAERLEDIDDKIRSAYDDLRKAGFDHQSHTQQTLKKKMRKIDTRRQEISEK